MKKWRQKRKKKREEGRYTFFDFVMDVLSWIPELLILPFRLIFWLFRGVGKIMGDLF